MFNFSATFTDARNYATCIFNFNLAKFIQDGYGKHIYTSELDTFKEKDAFSEIEKQKIVLKILILQTYIYKHFEKIKEIDSNFYHHPLLLTLVNSVNDKKSDLDKIVKEPDLKLFFAELEKIANKRIKESLLEEVKKELLAEFVDNSEYLFEKTKIEIDKNIFSKINYKELLQAVFNSNNPGKIEVLTVPKNKKEIAFKLQTSDIPFALIKIGNISEWLKNTLVDYQITESFENESIFKKINRKDSPINILMGSRSFYEGWDSNRPNILLFINIGVRKESKKFVLQSVGRGLRIEPLKNKRKRLQNLINTKEVEQELFEKIKNNISALESLFVFGTNAANLKGVIKTLEAEKQTEEPEHSLAESFLLNEEVNNRLLLVPTYKTSGNIFAESSTVSKYTISERDFNQTKKLWEYLGDKVILVKNECKVKVLGKVNESMQNKRNYYNFDETRDIDKAELQLKSILDYFSIQNQNFDRFKELEEEIVHFKEEPEHSLAESFLLNEEVNNRLLLVPTYKTSGNIFAESSTVSKYTISERDFNQTKKLWEYLGDKVILVKNECKVKVLGKVNESMQNKRNYYNFDETRDIDKAELQLKSILDYFSIQNQNFDRFKELEEEIVHFKNIKFRGNKNLEELKKKLEVMQNQPAKKKELETREKEIELKRQKLDAVFQKGDRVEYDKSKDDYDTTKRKQTEQLTLFETAETFELYKQKVKIKYLVNHYYHPLILAEREKVDYLNHIIDVPSEIKFIEDLEKYLEQPDNASKNYDWWMFSKLDETLDEIYIPYYNPKKNRIAHFFPDFIFWLKNGKDYTILFIDPKGTEYTDVARKIDGYKNIFEEKIGDNKQTKKYSSHGFTIRAQLLFKTGDTALAPENYRKYWFDNFKKIFC